MLLLALGLFTVKFFRAKLYKHIVLKYAVNKQNEASKDPVRTFSGSVLLGPYCSYHLSRFS